MSGKLNQLRFDNKVAIITGAGAGMGREHGLLLGQRGARVVLNDLFLETAEDTANKIRTLGGEAIVVGGSIADRQTAEAIVKTTLDHYGRVDILINNAGIGNMKPFENFDDSELMQILSVHLVGTWVLTQLVWPHMRRQQYGRILNVSSTSIFGMANNAAYISAKGALFALTRALSIEAAEHGINVNSLGPVADTALARSTSGEDIDTILSRFPASETSAVVAWLVHENCKSQGEFITCYGRNFGRVFLAETKGFQQATGDYTPETVRDNFEKAFDMNGFITPKSAIEGSELLFKMRSEGLL